MSELIQSDSSHNSFPAIIHPPQPVNYGVRTELRSLSNLRETAKPFNDIDVLEPMYAIAECLNPYLESYDLVVADDTSGRLPAIFYWRLVNLARRDSGLPKAAIRFHNGSTNADKAPLRLAEDVKTEGSRALVITESIITGYRTMNAYAAAANYYGEDSVDLATIGLEGSRLNIPGKLSRMGKGSNFFYGTVQRKITDAHLHHQPGAYKGVYGTMGSTPYSVTLASLEANRAVYRPAVTAARKTADELAEIFYRLLRPETKHAKMG